MLPRRCWRGLVAAGRRRTRPAAPTLASSFSYSYSSSSGNGGGNGGSNGRASGQATAEQDMSGFAYVKHASDDPPRLTCQTCNFIHYENPKVVIGSVATYEDPSTGEPLFLLCRRAIPPRRGFLNLPAGYMERGESLAAAAVREAREEATAPIECGPVLAIYDIAHIAQVHIYFLARITDPEGIRPGYESLDARLVPWSEIDWDNLAFPTVSWALMHHRLHRERSQAERRRRRDEQLAGRGGGGQGKDPDDPALWWEAQPPFRNPVLPGHEGSTNVWYKGADRGLVFDDRWLRRTG